MLTITSARLVWIGTSVAVHGAIALAVAVGHGAAQAKAPGNDAVTQIVDLEADPVIRIDEEEPAQVEAPVAALAKSAPAAPTPPSHTHPYAVSPSHDSQPHDPSLQHDHDHDHDHDAPAQAPAVVASPAADEPARFSMSIGGAGSPKAAVVSPGGTGNGAAAGGSGNASGSGGTATAEILPEARVSAPARLVSRAPAAYPPEAHAQEIEADVGLEIVVDASGGVIDARVTKRAGYGFDDSALRAIRGYRFSPAQKDGQPVRVRMAWTVSFHIH